MEHSVLGLDFVMALRPVSYLLKIGSIEVTPVEGEIEEHARDEQGNPMFEPGEDGARDFAKPIMRTVAGIVGHDTREVAGRRRHYGLIAQEVRAALDKAGVEEFGGWVKAGPSDAKSLEMLRYEEFVPVGLRAI